MKKQMNKKALYILILACMLGTSSAAYAQSDPDLQTKYYLYSMNKDGTAITSKEFTPATIDTDSFLNDMSQRLNRETSDVTDYIDLLPEGVRIEFAGVSDGILTVDLSKAYTSLDSEDQILIRYAIVMNYIQIIGVDSVTFTVNGKPLKDSNDEDIGLVRADDFLEFENGSFNSYRYESLTLYFQDKSEEKISGETRNIYYKCNLPKERVVVEQLVNGPMEDTNQTTFNPRTKLNSVMVSDGVCYLDFNEAFLEVPDAVSPKLSLSSLVSSIIATCGCKKVHISVDESTDCQYGDAISLDHFFTWKDETLY